MKFGKIFISIVIFITVLQSCSSNPWEVDVSKISVDFEIINVDSLYLHTDEKKVKDLDAELASRIGEAYKMEVANNTFYRYDSSAAYMMLKFYEHEFTADLEKEKAAIASERIRQLSDFNLALRYLRYHFPEVKMPTQIVLMNNMFSGVLLTEEQLFVGLERYLSGNNPVIESVPTDKLHQWQKDAMNIDFLARDMILPWIQVQLFKEKDEHLAYHIVQAGKVLTILQAVFPHRDPAFILRYSEEDWQWAEENEAPFWDYLVKEQLLFKNNMRDKANFLNEAPYTVGLPEKGPDRLGQYLGFKMVKSYMKQNKGLSLQELLQVDFNEILQAYEID